MGDRAIYVYVEGYKQGKFAGDGIGPEGSIHCLHFSHILNTLTYKDGLSGVSYVKPQHEPLMIRKLLNSTSLQFAKAVVDEETLKTVTIKFMDDTNSYYSIVLSDTVVTQICQYTPEPSVSSAPVEEIWLTYKKIEWQAGPGTASVSDEVK